MTTLLSIRTNILYAKKPKKDAKDPDEFKRYNEVILLVDNPSYKKTNDNEIIRERGVGELRFIVSQEAMDALITSLITLRDIDETELQP